MQDTTWMVGHGFILQQGWHIRPRPIVDHVGTLSVVQKSWLPTGTFTSQKVSKEIGTGVWQNKYRELYSVTKLKPDQFLQKQQQYKLVSTYTLAPPNAPLCHHCLS